MIQKVLDPETTYSSSASHRQREGGLQIPEAVTADGNVHTDSSEDEDSVGPALPKSHDPGQTFVYSSRSGPTFPNMQDLDTRNGTLTCLIINPVLRKPNLWVMLKQVDC